jgi:hypothetical protein
MRLRLGTSARLNNGECQLSLFGAIYVYIFGDALTSVITRVHSNGFHSDQYFVLFQFRDGDFFENYIYTLALRLSTMQGIGYA